jgi:hypothetical protein
MVVFFVIGMQFSGFDNKSIITGAINRTVDANPVGPLGLPPSFSWVCFMMLRDLKDRIIKVGIWIEK